MTAPLVPQEIYLLERYSSLEYFEQLVDAFAGCVKAGETALAKFMTQLPEDYRSRPLWQQPDLTWGETVLPNLRSTLASLNSGLVRIANGDSEGLAFAANVGTDLAALARDYDSDWISEPELTAFDGGTRAARRMARNIFITVQHEWLPGTLTTSYQSDTRGDLYAPQTWPLYRLATSIQVATGSDVASTGIYLPARNDSSAQFLIKGVDAPQCAVPRKSSDPAVFSAARDLYDTTWILVQRDPDTRAPVNPATGPAIAHTGLRCIAGDPCPKTGWWITPAVERSRRQFAHGEIMPTIAGDYGLTIWQWDINQEA